MDTREHPILDEPWRWEITRFEWRASGESDPSYLDVTFKRHDASRTLRFIDIRDVTLEFSGSYPIQCGDMAILDIRERQLDGLNVQVAESGASGSPLRLFARTVVDVSSE